MGRLPWEFTIKQRLGCADLMEQIIGQPPTISNNDVQRPHLGWVLQPTKLSTRNKTTKAAIRY